VSGGLLGRVDHEATKCCNDPLMPDDLPPSPEPRRRDRARSEATLIEAAQAEFSVHGFKATTTRAIAARAGCSEGLIQNYFGGKEGLLMAVMRAGVADQSDLLDSGFFGRPRAATAEAEMCELLAFIISFMRRLAPRLRILFDRVLLDPEFARRFADLTPRHRLVTAIAARLHREWPATVDPDRTADAIVSFGFELGFIHPELLGRGEQEVDASTAHYAALLAPALRETLTN
jgi:AcrR family transcriptional regulator